MAPKKMSSADVPEQHVEQGENEQHTQQGENDQHTEQGENDQHMDMLAEEFATLELDEFLAEVPASSNQTLSDLMPDLMDKSNLIQTKLRAIQQELKKRAKEEKKNANNIEKKKKEEEKKKRDQAERAITITIAVTLKNVIIKVSVPVTSTVGELRRLIIAEWNRLHPENKLKKSLITRMELMMGNIPLHERPRATLRKLNVMNCILQATIDDQNQSSDEDYQQPPDEDESDTDDQ